MGNADLRQLAVIEEVPFESVAGTTIAIDAHNWLYRYLTTVVRFTASNAYTTLAGKEVANLIGIVQGLPRFFEHDVTPVFVFDGAPSELKADEIEDRRESRERREEKLKEARERGDAAEIARLDSQTQRLTDVIQRTSRELLERLDVPIVEAPAEGEAQAAHIARQGDADSVGTEDYDALLFGAPVTHRNLTSQGDIERMELEATLERHGLTYEQLVDVAILCGTDFNEGVRGFGPKTAVEAIREHGDIHAVLTDHEADVPGADRIQQLFLDPPVTDNYAIDETPEPDLDAAREYVVEEWGVTPGEVERGFERIEEATSQAGLDRWT